MNIFSLVALLTSAALSGCAHYPLKPASGAKLAPEKENAAIAESGNVRVTANEKPWKGNPYNLSQFFTPLFLTIENDGGHPVRVQYRDFSLEVSSFSISAMPPYRISGSIPDQSVEPIYVQPAFFYSDFYLFSPYSHFYGPNMALWSHSYPFDYDYYYRYNNWQTPLPTQEMLEKAIPEGVLNPGGRLSGFLYFERVKPRGAPATFKFSMADPKTNEPLGDIQIPFQVR